MSDEIYGQLTYDGLAHQTLLDYPEKLDWKTIFLTLQKDGYRGRLGLETHIFGEGQIAASHSSMREIMRIVQEL